MRVYLDGFRYDTEEFRLIQHINKVDLVPTDLDKYGLVPVNFEQLNLTPTVTWELQILFDDGSIDTELKDLHFIGEHMLYCESIYLE